MKICLLSKYGTSTNLLYKGTRVGLETNNIEYLDINIEKERGIPTPRWISIPTLTPQNPPESDAQIIAIIKRYKPDIICALQYSGLSFLLDNAKEIKNILGNSGKILFWLVDLAEKIYENKQIGSLIDSFFISNTGQIDEYKNKWGIERIFFMPQGALIKTKSLLNPLPLSIPVGFLGRRQESDSRYTERNTILDSFKKNVNMIEQSPKTYEEAIRFYKESKIILGVSWKNDVPLYSSDRIFNALASGRFYLCEYFPGIERLFINHTHLVWFTSIEDGLTQARYYLSHDEERERIARNGLQLVEKFHTYSHRMTNILDIVSRKTDTFYGYL